MTGTIVPAGRDASRVPVRGLTVLYDAQCSLCRFLRGWLSEQRQLVPLGFVAAGSEEARRRYPGLDHHNTLDEITVIGDAGQVYRGPAAWIVCLWALREYRRLAHRLSTPAGYLVARGAVLAAAKWRETVRGRGGGRGGGVYRTAEGWAYDRRYGWTYNPPACGTGGSCGTG